MASPPVPDEQMRPPVALLAHAVDDPGPRAAFWPLAEFSPEWVAIRWALEREVPVRFIELSGGAGAGSAERRSHLVRRCGSPGRRPDDPARDPLGTLAAAAGYDDPGALVGGPRRVPAGLLLAVPAAGRGHGRAAIDTPAPPSPTRTAAGGVHAADDPRRPAAAAGSGSPWSAAPGTRRCSTWPLPPANADTRGAARQRQAEGDPDLGAVDRASGWPARAGTGPGSTSPGWYHHLWTAPEGTDPALAGQGRPGAARARTCRPPAPTSSRRSGWPRRWPASRSRPLAGLTEVTEATRAVLCDGDERGGRATSPSTWWSARRWVRSTSGCRRSRWRPTWSAPAAACGSAASRTCGSWDLDLRRTIDRNRSQLFHRLRLLELDWVRPAETDIASQGTFREVWASRWQPEYAVQLVEASVWGTTVEAAATARVDADPPRRDPAGADPGAWAAACWPRCRPPWTRCWTRWPSGRRGTPTWCT